MAKKPSKKTAKATKKDGGDDSETPREGLKLGTVVTLVSFHDEENESLRYDAKANADMCSCLLYTSPSPRDATLSRMPSSA